MGLLKAYMWHRIIVWHPTGVGDDGNPTGVETRNVPARVNSGNRLIRGPDGSVVPSTATIDTEYQVFAGDTVTLPDGTKQAAIRVDRIDGLGGRVDHYEVYL